MTVNSYRNTLAPLIYEWGRLSKNLSLRASAHTGVAIPRIFKHFHLRIQGLVVYLGDCHTR